MRLYYFIVWAIILSALFLTMSIFGGCSHRPQIFVIKKTSDGWIVTQQEKGKSRLKKGDFEVEMDTTSPPIINIALPDIKPALKND